jgi:myosin heavy subunit
VCHFAGAVQYTVGGFLDKNRDTMSLTAREVMERSDNTLVAGLFKQTATGKGRERGKKRWREMYTCPTKMCTLSPHRYTPLYRITPPAPLNPLPPTPHTHTHTHPPTHIPPPTHTHPTPLTPLDDHALSKRHSSKSTLGGQFRAQLISLLSTLNLTGT